MWNKFEASSSDDETLGNSFYTNGLFKISNEEKSTKNPRISAALQNKKILIAVDKSLIFLEDESTIDCKFLSFSSEINCFAASRSGDLIVCCLTDGNIHGVHIKGIPVFNLTIQEEDVSASRSFLDIIQSNDDFNIMCSNGTVYKLPKVDEQQLSEAILTANVDETCVFNESLASSAVLDKISDTKLPREIFSFCCIQSFKKEMFIASGSDHVFFIIGNNVERVSYPENMKPIKKIYNLENFVMGLTDDGGFVEISPFTKTMHLICGGSETEKIEDLRVLEANDEYIELLVLSALNSRNERTMKILDFPSMTCKSELTLPGVSWLVSQQKSSVNMYFIAGAENEEKFIQMIEIRSITETDPEQRFKKLLLRGHFDDAEAFAKEYDLDLEPLHQARVKKSLINIRCVKPSSPAFEKTFQQLMAELAVVKDKNFLITLHLTDIPDRSSMTIFLEFLLANIDTNKHQVETNEINELLLRLETLRLIDPDECNMQWQKILYHPDIVRLAMDYFKSDVLLSCLIWSRHSSSIIPKLNLEQFHKWLGNIPTTIEPFQLIQWLKHFSPCFLQSYPQEMAHLVSWCLERTRGLQFSNAWPEIGLEFINNINSIFKDVKFMFVDISRLYHNNMEKIQQMIFTLEEMAVLKKTYHLIMTLDDYSKGTIEETGLRLLQRIQMHNLKRMVNDFLYPIFMEHGSTPEDTIVKYIQFLCSNKNLGFWQERAVMSIELLHNEENRLNSALLVLKVSPVPWSDVILPLAKLGTTSSHPLAQSIYIEYKTQSIKIIKVKYQWPVDYFDFQQDRMKLVLRILKINNPEMIEDVKTVVNSSPDITHEAFFHLMLRLVEFRKIDDLMELVEFIEASVDTFQSLFEKVLDGFITMIDDGDVEDEQDMMEAVKLLVGRLKGFWDDYQVLAREQCIKDLKNILNLRRDFNLDIKLKNLQSSVDRKRFLNEGVAMVAVSAREKSSIDNVWCKIDLLVTTLKFDRIFGYKMLCEKLNNLFVTCQIVDVLTASVESFEKKEINSVMELTVIMIAQQISYFENNLAANFEHYDPLAFPLAFEFLNKCRVHNDILHHSSIIKLLNWITVARDYYSTDIIESTAKDRVVDQKTFTSKISNEKQVNGDRRESFSIFDTVETNIEVKQMKQFDENLNPVLRCVCNCFKVIVATTDKNSEPYRRFRSYLKASINHDQQQIKNDFFSSLENLLRLKQHKASVKIIQLICEQQKASNVIIIPQMFITNVNKKIIKYILSQKQPEYMEAFRIFRFELNRDECIDYLRNTLKNNSQKIAFSTFSEMYNNYIGNVGSVADERQNRLKFYYYSELCKYDQSLRLKTNFDNVGISDLLKDLDNRQLNVELVKKLSKDFGWDYQKALVQQIKILLRHQQMDFEVKTDVFGKEEVVVKSTVELIRNKCTPYLTEVTNMSLLAAELQSFMKEINFYFYEMYLVVLDLIEYSKDLTLDQKVYRNILLFLKHKLTTKRRGSEQVEIECWMKLQADNQNSVLPGISKFRLPFKPMMESKPEDFLNEDLNVDTFEKCIPLITMHASLCKLISEDRLEICAFQAVKNSVMDLKAKNETKNGNEWNLKPINNAFLQTMLRMVSLLKDKSKRMAILYFNVTHSPPGIDQVESAYECWKFAIAHEHELSPKYIDLSDKIKRKYPILKTQHLLHLYGLTDEKLMQLVENPAELVEALYHHESILQPQKKDINKLCDELTQLYNLDLLVLQNKLLHKWLAFIGNSSFEVEGDANETLYEDFIGSPQVNETDYVSNDECVIRAHYVLSSWKSDEAMDFLAGELSSSSGNTENQLQLYECFAKLIDDRSESYMDLINPNNYLLIKCCHFLKSLGLNLKQEKFKEMDKVEILKKIWTSHYKNSKGLEVMSFICLGFNVHLPQIWNGILKQMIALKMVSHLSILVEILSTKSQLLHLSNFKAAWECVMKEPFLHAVKTRSYEQEVALSKALILLQKCPISTFLDFENLIEICLRLERPHMAAIFVAFANPTSREKFVKLLEPFDKRELKKNIVELEEMGVAPVVTKSVTNILKL